VIVAGLVTVVVAVALVVGVCLSMRHDRLLKQRLRETVVATLKTGTAFSGVLYEVDGQSLVLRNARALSRNGDEPVMVDGELLLARADVEYMQRP
jgi:small nuclear ribonucleoprotein (snRNP)-like protein